MEDAPEQQDRRVGPAEQKVLDAFDPAQHPEGCFSFVTLARYAPDGQTILGNIFFLVCPICGAMVPAADDDRPEHLDFDGWHVEWHQQVARMEDSLGGLR